MADLNKPLVEIRDVTFGYGREVVLDHVSLEIGRARLPGRHRPQRRRQDDSAQGDPGAACSPWSGEVVYNLPSGHDPRGRLGYVPQFSTFDRDFPLRISDMVLMGRLGRRNLLRPYSREDRAAAERTIDRLGLAGVARAHASEVSGGQLQRALIARALVGDPEILFLDEPTASIDAESRDTLRDLLADLNRSDPDRRGHPRRHLAGADGAADRLHQPQALLPRRPRALPGGDGGGLRLPGRAGHPRRAAPGAARPSSSLERRLMPSFLDALSYEFLRNALLAGVLASVLCGIIGTFVVVKKLAFISDGISHAAFGGMGLCFFFGIDPLLGAIPVALACALALGAVDRETIRSYDALIGVLWAVGMAVGRRLRLQDAGLRPEPDDLPLRQHPPGDPPRPAGDPDPGGLGPCHLALFFKGIVAVAFDEVFARVRGVPVRLLMALLLGMIALSVVILIQVVGIILVVALLTIPLGDQPDALEGSAERAAGIGRDRRRHHPRRAAPLLPLRPPLGAGDHPARGGAADRGVRGEEDRRGTPLAGTVDSPSRPPRARRQAPFQS